MKSKKGQALVEFVIILPIIIYIIMGIIDYILIFDNKNKLDDKMNTVVKLYKDNKEYKINDYLNKDINAKYEIKKDNDYVYIKLSLDYEFITPGLPALLGSPYEINTERVMLNE